MFNKKSKIMKELTIEQKAQRYDEVLKKAKDFYKGYKQRDNQLYADDLESIFPELAESEDEEIRKSIIAILKNYVDDSNTFKSKMITWLEKQDEQKPAVEMKTLEESLGIDSDTYNKIVDECIYGEQKPAWSEEDERMKNQLVDFMLSGIDISKAPYGCVAWLKSLKDRYTWKPSEEQLKSLQEVIDVGHFTSYPNALETLYEQLKQL